MSEYKILELNPEVKNYEDIDEGDQIKITTSYAKETFLYVCVKTYIPVAIEVMDEKGLYEKYSFHEIQLNPTITPEEFSYKYEAYGF